MGILDVFKGKKAQQNEANTLFGQTALGNNIVYQGDNKRPTVNTQILYVTPARLTMLAGWWTSARCSAIALCWRVLRPRLAPSLNCRFR